MPQLASALGAVASARSALTRVGVDIPGLSSGSPGAWQLEQMRADADTGAPLLLADGRGRIWGYWVITELEETESRHLADGAALAIRFRVTLAYYGETAPAAISADTSLVGAVRGLLGI